ncbi:MAG: extracellular solute-binding protein [Candidatus Atribacteria bacterium]|nr:extracellular solute-binding protein [Candidatus Atribacteria bacterium]
MRKNSWLVVVSVIFILIATSSFALAQDKKMFDGITVTIATLAGGVKGPISGPLYLYRQAWEELTGGKVNIVEIPFAQLPTKIKTDLITGAGKYDVMEPCGTMYGDLIAGNFIIPLDDFYNDKSGKYPAWDINEEGPPLAALYKWGGKLYGVLNDSDSWIVYGRKDAFANPDYQKKFKEKYGYDLTWPPKNTDQYLDYCDFFNGWDWNGDGKDDYGNVMPLRVGAQGVFYFMAWLAPYITMPGPKVDAFHNTSFFNPETMEPAINNPGSVKALEDYVRMFQSAPKGSLGWDLAEGWDNFLKGHAAVCINPGDIGSLAQEAEKSIIKGKLLCAPIPTRMRPTTSCPSSPRERIWNR